MKTNEELVAAVQAGENVQDNMAALYQQNHGLIYKIVRKYSEHAEMADLMQEAYIGLDKAVKGYDLNAGTKFATYAGYWIRQQCLRYIQNNCTAIRQPVSVHEQLGKYAQYLEQNPAATDADICKALKISKQALQNIRYAYNQQVLMSLNEPCADGSGQEVGDFIPDTAPDLLEVLASQEAQKSGTRRLNSLINRLPGRQHDAVVAICYQNRSVKDLAAEWKISQQAVSDAYWNGIEKLRSMNEMLEVCDELEFFPGAYSGGVGSFNRIGTSATENTAMKRMNREKTGRETGHRVDQLARKQMALDLLQRGWTAAKVAEYMGISVRQLYRWKGKG